MKELEDVPGLYIMYDSRMKKGFLTLTLTMTKCTLLNNAKRDYVFLEGQQDSNKLAKQSTPI